MFLSQNIDIRTKCEDHMCVCWCGLCGVKPAFHDTDILSDLPTCLHPRGDVGVMEINADTDILARILAGMLARKSGRISRWRHPHNVGVGIMECGLMVECSLAIQKVAASNWASC